MEAFYHGLVACSLPPSGAPWRRKGVWWLPHSMKRPIGERILEGCHWSSKLFCWLLWHPVCKSLALQNLEPGTGWTASKNISGVLPCDESATSGSRIRPGSAQTYLLCWHRSKHSGYSGTESWTIVNDWHSQYMRVTHIDDMKRRPGCHTNAQLLQSSSRCLVATFD